MVQRKAIAVFNNKIKGIVRFKEVGHKVRIDVELSGLTPLKLQGFHVHEKGDLSDGCNSACAHFNPYNKKHGGQDSQERHVGDLGNIVSDKYGKANYYFHDSLIKLHGKCNIIGRSLIIHKDEDDCGKGGDAESLKTGNSGKRIDCAVIGII